MAARRDRPSPPEQGWRRYLGPPDSWRRVVLTGIAGGVALAVVAAIVGSVAGGFDFGSLDKKQPMPVPVIDTSSDVVDNVEPAIDVPVEELPTEEPADVPIDTPVEEAPVDVPTEEPVVPTDTPVDEVPTELPPDEAPEAGE